MSSSSAIRGPPSRSPAAIRSLLRRAASRGILSVALLGVIGVGFGLRLLIPALLVAGGQPGDLAAGATFMAFAVPAAIYCVANIRMIRRTLLNGVGVDGRVVGIEHVGRSQAAKVIEFGVKGRLWRVDARGLKRSATEPGSTVHVLFEGETPGFTLLVDEKGGIAGATARPV